MPPAPSRSTVKTGCATKRTSSPRSASSASTESTRNGMSSLTISSTDLRAARAGDAGVSRRIFGTPGCAAPAATRRPRPARRADAGRNASGPRAPRRRTARRRSPPARRAVAFTEDPRRRGDQRCFGAFLVGARRIGGGHRSSSRLPGPRRITRVFPITAMASRTQIRRHAAAAGASPDSNHTRHALGWTVPRPRRPPVPRSSKQPTKSVPEQAAGGRATSATHDNRPRPPPAPRTTPG